MGHHPSDWDDGLCLRRLRSCYELLEPQICFFFEMGNIRHERLNFLTKTRVKVSKSKGSLALASFVALVEDTLMQNIWMALLSETIKRCFHCLIITLVMVKENCD